MVQLESRFEIVVPAWVAELVAAAGETLDSLERQMSLVNALAARNVRDGGGGPFAAIVVERDSGAVIAAGVNRVLSSGVSVAHAEVVALSLAQRARGSWDLGAAGSPATRLVVNWRPCVQCFGAVLWSGVSHLVIPDDSADLEQVTGFDEGPLVADWIDQFARRGITVTRGIGRDEALAVFTDYADWVARGEAIVYNARGTGVNVRSTGSS